MRLSIGLDLFEQGYKLNFCNLYLPVPVKNPREPKDIMESWGVSMNKESISFRWGAKYKMYFMPWDWGCCVRHEVMNYEDILEKEIGKIFETGKPVAYKDNRKIYKDSYIYTLKSGEIQERVATYYVDEMEWRWRIFQRLYKKGFKLGPKKVMRCISVEFNDEVGERTGSWKGGTLGCGYEMLQGESPWDTLRRMERERKF